MKFVLILNLVLTTNPPNQTMNEEQKQLYRQIREHLGKLHKDWQEDPDCDGHCKINEGYVGILWRGDNWFETGSDYDTYVKHEPQISRVEVYSYLFGPYRLHSFGSLEEAWDEVKTW